MTSWNAFEHDGFNGFRSIGYNARNGGGGCPDLIITIAGMDAAVCCTTDLGIVSPTAGDSITYSESATTQAGTSFDGDYTVSATSIDTNGVCNYLIPFGPLWLVAASDEVCGDVSFAFFLTSLTMTIKYDTTTSKIIDIYFGGEYVPFGSGATQTHIFFRAESISEDLGVAIANQVTVCDYYRSGSARIYELIPGGTIEVNLDA
jgi:hypothetical protein